MGLPHMANQGRVYYKELNKESCLLEAWLLRTAERGDGLVTLTRRGHYNKGVFRQETSRGENYGGHFHHMRSMSTHRPEEGFAFLLSLIHPSHPHTPEEDCKAHGSEALGSLTWLCLHQQHCTHSLRSPAAASTCR